MIVHVFELSLLGNLCRTTNAQTVSDDALVEFAESEVL